jgi:hypothetical protein
MAAMGAGVRVGCRVDGHRIISLETGGSEFGWDKENKLNQYPKWGVVRIGVEIYIP